LLFAETVIDQNPAGGKGATAPHGSTVTLTVYVH
jgi:hypothetical protein